MDVRISHNSSSVLAFVPGTNHPRFLAFSAEFPAVMTDDVSANLHPSVAEMFNWVLEKGGN